MLEITVTESISGGRLDKMLIKYLDKAQRSFIYKMLRKKNIVLNGKKASGSELLKAGDVITLYFAEETLEKFHSPVNKTKAPVRSRLSSLILYEDENILAVNKPSGLLSQKGTGKDISMNDMIQDYLGKDDFFTPGISNRLDRNTSGIILAGKNPQSVRLLNESIRSRHVQKLYLALACGQIEKDVILEGYLTKDRISNKSAIYQDLSDAGPDADKRLYIKTAVHPVSSNDRCSLLLIDLLTGRSHQIRSQLSFEGHGIIGDMKYGDSALNDVFYRKYSVRSQLLHAYRIRFCDMRGNLTYLNSKEITADIPEEFLRSISGEGLCLPGDQEDSEVLSLNS